MAAFIIELNFLGYEMFPFGIQSSDCGGCYRLALAAKYTYKLSVLMSAMSDHPPLAYQPTTPTNLKTCGLLERLLIAQS